MAQANDKRKPQGKSGSGPAQKGAGQGAAPNGAEPKGAKGPGAQSKGSQPARKPTVARESVAAARRSSDSNNRTQLIIGGIAVVVIIGIIVIGLVLNKQETAVQGDGYGPSTRSVASATDGVVTVTAGGSPKVTIDVFEDALCPICAEFERQFGQQINKAVDEGKLAVNYHMLTFLDPRSFSGDYSTRAAAALLCVAQEAGSQQGVYLGFHSALFATDTQPAEGGSADLTNKQLAEIATSSGAPSAAECIGSGANVAAATTAAEASSAELGAATGRVATPTVLHNGAPVELSVDWLTALTG